MKATLSTRLIVWVGVPAALVLGFVVWNASRRSFDRVAAQTEQLSRLMARSYAAELENGLSEVRKIPEMIGRTLETNHFDTPEKVESFLKDVVEKNPEIYGSCIAFRPHGLNSELNAYAPYWYRSPEGAKFEQLAKPDYNYFQWDWYRLPRDAGHPMWTEPYFDDGGGNTIMITYSAPFRRDESFWGIATIDIAMSQLMEKAEKATVGKTGYVFIVSKQGRFLAYPEQSKIMQASIQDSHPELGKHMLAGESGFLRTREPWKNQEAWIAFAPVQNGELSLAIVYPEDEALAEARQLRTELLATGLIGLFGLFGVLIVIARSISKPIQQLAHAAQLVADGDLEQRLTATAPTEEVRNLMNAFNKMTRDLQMRMQELRYTTTVKERFEGELNAARSIQMSLVPKNFPAFPGRPEFDVHALLRPAREIGGDLYDFYFLDDDWLCFLIGDVSGKGVPAALFMAVTKTLLKASSSRRVPMAQLMQQVNDELCEQTDSGMFVSLIYGHLHTKTGELEFTNAGHPAPYLLAADASVRPLAGEKDVALGAMSGLEYHSNRLQLAAGEALFFFTDGVPEALDRSEHFYANTRLEIILHDLAALPVEKITRGVVRDVRTFCGEREQSDDISVMAIRWTGPEFAEQLAVLSPHPVKKSKPMAVKKSDILVTKHFVLDTNVLIHDPQSMFQFENNIVWVPVEVLEELDRFKSESTTRGANAREVHRRLSERFRTTEQMRTGVKLDNGGKLHVFINPALKHEGKDWKLIEESPRSRLALDLFPDLDSTDNRILASAAYLADTQAAGAVLVTKDLNMQLKARALGLEAQDYRTDRVEDNDIRRTQRRSGAEEHAAIDLPGHTIQAFASQERISLPHLEMLIPNQYVLLRNEEEPSHGVPARHLGEGEFVKLRHDHVNIRGGRGLQAANLGQRFLLDALYDPSITLVTVYGKAGTGKTLLSVGAALEQVQNGDYEKMLITRVIMPTGRDIGFLPGRMEEKMQPWVQPAYDALELLLSRPRKPEHFDQKKQSKRKAETGASPHSQSPSGASGGKFARPYEPLMQAGILEIEAMAHIRGRSIPRAIFIVDESQQLTPHEAKTLVTRMGKGSKIILIGDLAQIDNPYVDAHTNGLVYTRNRLQGQPFMAHVNLFKGERSEMAEVAANVM